MQLLEWLDRSFPSSDCRNFDIFMRGRLTQRTAPLSYTCAEPAWHHNTRMESHSELTASCSRENPALNVRQCRAEGARAVGKLVSPEWSVVSDHLRKVLPEAPHMILSVDTLQRSVVDLGDGNCGVVAAAFRMEGVAFVSVSLLPSDQRS